MIHYTKGDILDSHASALVNTVNLMGIMGKGIALQFKKRFPNNYKEYQKACKENRIGIGKLFVTKESTMFGEQYIINFPTKTDWRKSSEYLYIEEGLTDLIRIINEFGIQSISIPPLGAGNGGLNWERVKRIIEQRLSHLAIDIYLYEPSTTIIEKLKAERVSLTPARALLLYILFDLVRHGEYVSEFSSEKICYFLQRFGASHLFNLKFEPRYYGPYSGKVRYVLNALNGSYLMGYSDMSKKPFESLLLIPDTYEEVKSVVESNCAYKEIAQNTQAFLSGYYSDFALELLSSVDYILCQNGNISEEEIYKALASWSNRKKDLFKDQKYIRIAKNHLINSSLSYNH